MTGGPGGVSPGWLGLREPADADARSAELVEEVRPLLHTAGRAVIRDLGCGIGSMARWLAPRLSGPQHWILYDWNAELLARAADTMPGEAADGTDVSVATCRCDVTWLSPDELAGASLITASALLDLLSEPELERLVTTCVVAGSPVLLTMTVVGRVELTPADPLDERIADAFNAHQRRMVDGRRLLGPDAGGVAAELFTRLGAEVLVRPSPWRLGATRAALAAAWMSGWVRAACEEEPDLTSAAGPYLRRRLTEVSSGRTSVTVHHQDLLARPHWSQS